VEERRTGTVSGLALLVGATALAAVAGGAHSVFATLLLGLLSLGLSHSLYVEIGRQAHRRAGWSRHDTINTAVLAACGETALLITIITPASTPLRAVGLTFSLGYAAACGLFVTQRRRAIAATAPQPSPGPTLTSDSAAQSPTSKIAG
jgi:hypothetical protein